MSFALQRSAQIITRHVATRSISTTRPAMAPKEWLVLLPDAPGKLEQRMKVRPDHLNNIKPNVQAGKIVMGGATLEEHPAAEGDPLRINGSALLAVGESKEEVLDSIVKSDIYAKSGVWDLDKIQVFPFKSAVRTAM